MKLSYLPRTTKLSVFWIPKFRVIATRIDEGNILNKLKITILWMHLKTQMCSYKGSSHLTKCQVGTRTFKVKWFYHADPHRASSNWCRFKPYQRKWNQDRNSHPFQLKSQMTLGLEIHIWDWRSCGSRHTLSASERSLWFPNWRSRAVLANASPESSPLSLFQSHKSKGIWHKWRLEKTEMQTKSSSPLFLAFRSFF